MKLIRSDNMISTAIVIILLLYNDLLLMMFCYDVSSFKELVSD